MCEQQHHQDAALLPLSHFAQLVLCVCLYIILPLSIIFPFQVLHLELLAILFPLSDSVAHCITVNVNMASRLLIKHDMTYVSEISGSLKCKLSHYISNLLIILTFYTFRLNS